MSTPPEQKRSQDSVPAEFLPPQILPVDPLFESNLVDLSSIDDLANYINDWILQSLPNDLTRMIFLASLRDCNSGLYLHPELSHQQGPAADRAFRICHERLFHRLLTTRLPEYVRQLQEYIRYTRGETLTMLKTWKSLQAYRATVPLGVPATSSELFFLNLSIALEILSQETAQTPRV